MRTIFIGTDGEQAYDLRRTEDQIRHVKTHRCRIEGVNGEKLTWDMLENPDSPTPLLALILNDRKNRTIACGCLTARPNFCVVTVHDGDAVRLEYYEGRERLQLAHDLRSSDLRGAALARFLDDDPVAAKSECFRNAYIRYRRNE